MQGEILDGRYELLQRLGRGGMGEVWVARDMRMERQVAVKLLYGRPRDEAGSDELRRRFRREVQAAARLPGRHTVTAHDWGEALVEDERRLYMVMELLHGPTLADAVRRRRPDWRTAADWAAQVATALDAAHRQHIVHRDLKPQNVMFAADGDVRLLDFGIAKFVGATDRSGPLTATGAPIGTLHWMSPEQAHGRTDVDHRSDLYALGCLLYFMVTGGPPIVVDHVGALLVRLEEGPVVRPREHVAALPAGLDALIMHLLAVAPGQRPQSAAEVLARLRELSAEGPVPAAGTSPADASAQETESRLTAARERLAGVDARLAEVDARLAGAQEIYQASLRDAEERRKESERVLAAAHAEGGEIRRLAREEAAALSAREEERAALALGGLEDRLARRRARKEREIEALEAQARTRLSGVENRAEQVKRDAERRRKEAEERAREMVSDAREQVAAAERDGARRLDAVRAEAERAAASLAKARSRIAGMLAAGSAADADDLRAGHAEVLGRLTSLQDVLAEAARLAEAVAHGAGQQSGLGRAPAP
ncbi:protein kinase [Streptomyces sp. NPDC090029]|uniref:serine/threonine protein kinase n=1 Tax=Streptomyces sp. NPDC090029 TaxID=3365924 RepID=UPI0038096419